MMFCVSGRCCAMKIVLSSYKKEATEKGHDMRTVGGTRYYAVCYCLVVTEKADAKGRPLMTPGCCSQHDGVQFLPLDAPLQLSLGPAAIKPLPLAVGTKANGPRAVCEQLKVRYGNPAGQKEEGAAIPWSYELVPPLEVEQEGLRQGDDLLQGGGRGAEVHHPPEECPASRDHQS